MEYVTGLESKQKQESAKKALEEAERQKIADSKRIGLKGPQITQLEHKRIIAKQKFNQSKDFERI